MKAQCVLLAVTMALAPATFPLWAQDNPPKAAKPEDTEIWSPEPPGVKPGPYVAAPVPSDAIVLFDGTGLQEWVSVKDGSPAKWIVGNGLLTVKPGAGSIQTRRKFGDYQLHVEWRVPLNAEGTGNSGLFLASTGDEDAGYELQIFDSYTHKIYVNGQAGSIYKQFPPLVNATRPPGEWQTYDVIWIAPRFSSSGSVLTPASVTVIHNGVIIQNHVELTGETLYIGRPAYRPHGPSPIKLQDHDDAVSFRNIWVRELNIAHR
jgi:3-keto-disaccharide hydrolase